MSGCNLVLATWENLRDPNQILLVPISIWPGLEQGFLGADFTAVKNSLICLKFNYIENCRVMSLVSMVFKMLVLSSSLLEFAMLCSVLSLVGQIPTQGECP